MTGTVIYNADASGVTEERASLENPRVSLSDPDAWNSIFGSGANTEAGVNVTPKKALGFAAVWQCVDLLSGDLAKLPLDVYKRTGKSSREHDDQHSAYRLVRRKANREMTAFHFWRTVMVHCLLWRNAYVYVSRTESGINGRPLELIPMLPDRTKPMRKNGELGYTTETTKPDGSPWERFIPAADVLHIRGFSLDGLKGCELVDSAREAFGLALMMQKFLARYYKHGVRAGGILELPANMSDKATKTVAEGFRRFDGGDDNWFKVAVLRDGAKFHQTSLALQDSQTNETRESQVREVARFFNILPSRLGLSDSVSYNSKAEDNQAYLDSTLSPWLTAITAECHVKLLSDREQMADSHYFEHNTASLLRTNIVQRHQVYAIGLRNRVYTRNEVRAWENLNPVDGGDEFDDFASSGGQRPGGGDGGADNQPADGGDNTKSNPDAPTRAHAVRRLVFRMGDHARKKAQNPRAFLEWIDGGLASHRADAAAWTGGEELVDSFLRELRHAAETVSNDGLPAAVEQLASQLEMAV